MNPDLQFAVSAHCAHYATTRTDIPAPTAAPKPRKPGQLNSNPNRWSAHSDIEQAKAITIEGGGHGFDGTEGW